MEMLSALIAALLKRPKLVAALCGVALLVALSLIVMGSENWFAPLAVAFILALAVRRWPNHNI